MQFHPIWRALDALAPVLGEVFNVTVVVRPGDWEALAWRLLILLAALGVLQWFASCACLRLQRLAGPRADDDRRRSSAPTGRETSV